MGPAYWQLMQNRKTPRAKPEEQIFPNNALLAEFRPSFFLERDIFFFSKNIKTTP